MRHRLAHICKFKQNIIYSLFKIYCFFFKVNFRIRIFVTLATFTLKLIFFMWDFMYEQFFLLWNCFSQYIHLTICTFLRWLGMPFIIICCLHLSHLKLLSNLFVWGMSWAVLVVNFFCVLYACVSWYVCHHKLNHTNRKYL